MEELNRQLPTSDSPSLLGLLAFSGALIILLIVSTTFLFYENQMLRSQIWQQEKSTSQNQSDENYDHASEMDSELSQIWQQYINHELSLSMELPQAYLANELIKSGDTISLNLTSLEPNSMIKRINITKYLSLAPNPFSGRPSSGAIMLDGRKAEYLELATGYSDSGNEDQEPSIILLVDEYYIQITGLADIDDSIVMRILQSIRFLN